MLAFHNKTSVKTKYLRRVRAHAKADELVKGTYWQEGRGCAVGCTIHGDEHDRYETEMGIPTALAHLEDRIFEGLPNAVAMKWPDRFLSAIAVGADLSGVRDRFIAWLIRDVARFSNRKATTAAILTVADLYDQKVSGVDVPVEKWREARSAARAARAAAAYAAGAAAAACAAYAADAAAYAAYAAYAAAYAAAVRKKARGDHYEIMADKLIELLKSAPKGTP